MKEITDENEKDIKEKEGDQEKMAQKKTMY